MLDALVPEPVEEGEEGGTLPLEVAIPVDAVVAVVVVVAALAAPALDVLLLEFDWVDEASFEAVCA